MSQNPPYLWSDEDEGWKRSFFLHDNREILWSNNDVPRRDILLVSRLLAREGPLIAKNLTLSFGESLYHDWPCGLGDFLGKYGDWFSTLEIVTTPDYNNLRDYPMTTDEIEHIRTVSRIPSIVIRSPNLEPFVPLIREPHVRQVKLIQTKISEKEIALLRHHHWDSLTLCNCIFDLNALHILQDYPVQSLKIIRFICYETSDDINMLPEYPCLQELSIDDPNPANNLNTFFSTLSTLTTLQKLLLPCTRDRNIEILSTLTNLSSLDISNGYNLGDRTMNVLSQLPRLRKLNIADAIQMTPARCDQIVQGCPLLEQLTCAYGGIHEGPASTTELLEMILTLTQLSHLQKLSLELRPPLSGLAISTLLSSQLCQVTSPSLRFINARSFEFTTRNLLDERDEILSPDIHRYLYMTFILVRAWNQRVGSMVVFPKDIVNMILTEYAPFLIRSPFAIKKMVEFVWNNWQQMERSIHDKRRFKVVQSRSGENVKLVGLSQEQRWEVV